jgi:hypothetical protein
MDWVHWHLMLNHIPVLGTFFVGLVLLWGVARGSRDVQRLGLMLAVALAAVTYPISLTGEEAEEGVEHLAWVDKEMIHAHEEAAEAALIAVVVTGLVAAFALWQSRGGKSVGRAAGGLALVGLVVSAGLFARTALAGGVIRHDELRAGAPGTAGGAAAPDEKRK